MVDRSGWPCEQKRQRGVGRETNPKQTGFLRRLHQKTSRDRTLWKQPYFGGKNMRIYT